VKEAARATRIKELGNLFYKAGQDKVTKNAPSNETSSMR
jgi:hypothetical protein